MFKVLFFSFVIGYIFYNVVKFISSIFLGMSGQKKEQQVYESENRKNTIDKKDVIDAQFEELDDKDKPS